MTNTVQNMGLIAQYTREEKPSFINRFPSRRFLELRFLDFVLTSEVNAREIFVPSVAAVIEAERVNVAKYADLHEPLRMVVPNLRDKVDERCLADVLTDKGVDFAKEYFVSIVTEEEEEEFYGKCACGYKGAYENHPTRTFARPIESAQTASYCAAYGIESTPTIEWVEGTTEEMFYAWLQERTLLMETHYASGYCRIEAFASVEPSVCCPSCGNKDFHTFSRVSGAFGTLERASYALFNNEKSIVLSLITEDHLLFTTALVGGKNKSVYADYDTPEKDTRYVFKKHYWRLVTNKETNRTYLVQPGTNRPPMDVSYSAVFNASMFEPRCEGEKEVFAQYVKLMLSDVLHPAAAEKIVPFCAQNCNTLGQVVTLRRIPTLNLLGDRLFDVRELAPATKKALRSAKNKKEAYKALIPAIGKQGMKVIDRIGFTETLFFGGLFQNTDKLNTFLSILDHETAQPGTPELPSAPTFTPCDDPFAQPMSVVNDDDLPWDIDDVPVIVDPLTEVKDIKPACVEKVEYIPTYELADTCSVLDYTFTAKDCRNVLLNFYSQQVLENEIIRYARKDSYSLHGLKHTIVDIAAQYKNIQDGMRKMDAEEAGEIKGMIEEFDYSSLQQLHDGLSGVARAMHTKKVNIKYSESEMERFTFSHGEYHFRPAVSNHELTNVGSAMNICVGMYGESAVAKHVTILLGFEGSNKTPVFCIELDPTSNAFKQVKEKHNALVKDPARIEAVTAYAKHAKAELDCYDTHHYHAVLNGEENVKIQPAFEPLPF